MDVSSSALGFHMGKSLRARAEEADEKVAADSSGKSGQTDNLQEQYGNEFLAGVIETAAADVGEDQWFSFEDPEKFEFAEDNENQKQDLALPGLRDKHEKANEEAIAAGDEAKYQYEDMGEGGNAFVKGEGDEHVVAANDVKQGSLGDCYLIAGMAAVARANPDAIKKLIKDNGNGTYDVTLWYRRRRDRMPQKTTVTIDLQLVAKRANLPLYAKGGDKGEDGKTEFWCALLEKALAQKKGNYNDISGGNINKGGFHFAGSMEFLTGQVESYLKVDDLEDDDIMLYVACALDDGHPVMSSTRNLKDDADLTKSANAKNVYWNHAYAPSAYDLDAMTISLQNPWGSHHVEKLSIEDYRRFYKQLRVGEAP